MTNMAIRLAAAAAVGLAVGFGVMIYDKKTGAEWAVAPENVGQPTANGGVTVRAIRSETADILPYKWVLFGVIAGVAVLLVTRQQGQRPGA